MAPVRRHLAWWVLVVLMSASVASVAAEQDKEKASELDRKAEEVRRLKEELSRAESELKRLEGVKEKESGGDAGSKVPKQDAPEANAISTAPAVPAGKGVIDALELANYFKAEPLAARDRFFKKVVSIRGKVSGFDLKLMARNYEVLIEAPGAPVVVTCNFKYIDKYDAVYTTSKGRVLTVRRKGFVDQDLLQVGDVVVIRGKCRGLSKGELRLTECVLVR